MHYALHMLFHCIALWCAISGGNTARSAVSPEILANFAKNVASVISPAILGDIQQRNNRSSLQSILIPIRFNGVYPDASSTLDNVVDKTTNAANYYEPRSNPYTYNGLYENPQAGVDEQRASGGLEQPLPESYLRQERPSFYNQPYTFPPNDNFRATEKPVDDDVESSIGNIEQSPTNQYSAYAGGFGPYFGGKPYGGFHGGPYGPYGGHFHPYDGHPDGDGEGGSSDENAQIENNSTNHRGYGPPHFGPHGGYGPYGGGPLFPYGGYGLYGSHHRNGNDTDGRDDRYGHHGPYHGPYHGGPDFYGPPGYGHNYGYDGNGRNGNGNDNGGSSRQTEEAADNGDRDNSTKNGYPYPYGPPLKPLIPLHGFPFPFNVLPYDHFHFKGGPVAGVGHVGYPIFADPYLIGYPFHFPYGPFFHGKKYLPPKRKPADSGESDEQPESAGELADGENTERITAISQEEVASAPTSNRYKTSEQREFKHLGLINLKTRRL